MIKHYDPEHQFADAEITRLLEAALQPPSSCSMQNWRFVLVRDKELWKQIRAAAKDQAHVSKSSLLIVMTAGLKACMNGPQRYWQDAPEAVNKLLSGRMALFYEGKEQLQRDETMRSCGIAGMTILPTAKAMGYDSCPTIGFDAVKVGRATKPA